MLFDELKESLKEIKPNLDIIKKYWESSNLETALADLEKESNDPNFWQNPNQGAILKKVQKLKTQKEQFSNVFNKSTELEELIDLFSSDESELENLSKEIVELKDLVNKLKVYILLNDPQDDSNCFLTINSGAGGTESQDWAEMILRMYVRFAERENLSATILDYQVGEGAGIKSADIFIKGKNAYGLLKGEQGIHRLVRISPYDANKRRHTSFASVTVSPEIPETQITVEPKDLRIDTYRASGAGGQHVNKTESAVRITHLPTNIVVSCQIERSQIQNRETAMKMLLSKLMKKQQDEEAAKAASVEKKKIEWGSQIRSYILHPYKMVKDHRTDLESPQPNLVLDGELMQFIEAFLIESSISK